MTKKTQTVTQPESVEAENHQPVALLSSKASASRMADVTTEPVETPAVISVDESDHKLPPFLTKLQVIVNMLPHEVGRWSRDGKRFDIVDEVTFLDYLRDHFAASKEATFIRQLHYYGFRKVDAANGGGDGVNGWSFMHESFTRDHPEGIASIKRRAERADRTVPSKLRVKQQTRVAELEQQVSALKLKVSALQRQLAEAKGGVSAGVGKKRLRRQAAALVVHTPLVSSEDLTDDMESLLDFDLSSRGNERVDLEFGEDVFESSSAVEPLPVDIGVLDLSRFESALNLNSDNDHRAPVRGATAPTAQPVVVPTPEQLSELLPLILSLPMVQQALLTLPHATNNDNVIKKMNSWEASHCVGGAC